MRTLSALLLVAAAPALVLGASGVPALGTTTTGTTGADTASVALPLVQARSAASVVDGFGVGVHMAYLDTPYRDVDGVTRALTTLGVRHVRDDLFLDSPAQLAAMRKVAARGIGFDLIMGSPRSTRPARDYVATVATQLPGVVESLEGPNEWDHFSGGAAGWPAQLRTRQAALYAAAKAEPRTAALPVLAPSLAFAKNYPLVGDLSATSDVANGHLYPGGRPPSADVAGLYSKLRTATGATKPLVVTEAGYHNAVNTTDGHLPVPESVHATYLPRLLMEHLRAGGKRVYSYELIDEFVDPGKVNPEANFGLLRRDLSPKPAYTAMQRFLGIFRDSSATHVPQGLAYRVVGGGSDLRQQLVQQSNGEFDLVLWRDVSVWDPTTQRALTPAPYRVQVQLDQARSGSVVVPARGTTATFGSSTTTAVDLGTDLTVVRLPAPSSGGTLAPSEQPAEQPVDTAPAPSSPAAPTAFRATAGSGSATLTWEAPAGAADAFVVEQAPGGSAVVVPGDRRSWVVRGLRDGQRYDFAVRARTGTATSLPTTAVGVVPASAPGRSTSVRARPGKASVRVGWGAAATGGAPVEAYRVTVGSKVRVVSAGTRSAALSGLKRRTAVRVGVQARNRVGWGPVAWSARVRTR